LRAKFSRLNFWFSRWLSVSVSNSLIVLSLSGIPLRLQLQSALDFRFGFLSFCIPHSLLCSGSGSGSGSGSRLVFLSNLRNVYPINASLNRGMSNSIVNKEEPKELRDESDFESVFSNDSYISVCGFGSLLSERSARSTFPELINFRVARLNGFRRLFGNVAPVFFERGIAKPETKEISSLCAEPCEGETIIVTVFEIKKSEIPAFIQREIEFRFLAVLPETLDGKLYDKPSVLCSRSTDEEFFREMKTFIFSIMVVIILIRSGEMISYPVASIFDTAAKNLGDTAYNNFLDHTFLGDRRTTIREYLATNGSGIMEEEPPESLKFRYGG
ncbi:hypothetical protein SDJN02_12830, partial [Cucurbita argyrosperma subsp. argyrosperma]